MTGEAVTTISNNIFTRKDLINLVAIFLWPLLAIRASDIIQRRNQTRTAMQDIFETILQYRKETTPVHKDFVSSLNKIIVVFYKHERVIWARNKLFDKLSAENQNKNQLQIDWLIADLLYEMASILWYNIKQTAYFDYYSPQQFADTLMIDNILKIEMWKFFKNANNLNEVPLEEKNAISIDSDVAS